MSSQLRFKRLYSGTYVATGETRLQKELVSGEMSSRQVDVKVRVERHTPQEWGDSGASWWRVEVETVEEDPVQLTLPGDITGRTYREAKDLARVALGGGWIWRDNGLGWCSA